MALQRGRFEHTGISCLVSVVIAFWVVGLTLGGVARSFVGLPGVAIFHSVVELPTVVALLLVGQVPIGVVSGLGVFAFAFVSAIALRVCGVALLRQVLLHQADEELLDLRGRRFCYNHEHPGFGHGAFAGLLARSCRRPSGWPVWPP